MTEEQTEKVIDQGDPVDNVQKTTLPWMVMLGLLGLTMGLLSLCGWGAGAVQAIGLIALTGLGALVVGAFVGFIFGIPRAGIFVYAATEDDQPHLMEEGLPAVKNRGISSNYQPSTNLEQVSDWLTKIIIGVGLVEFGNIGAVLQNLGEAVNRRVVGINLNIEVLTISTVVIFAIIGFMGSYLWTRIHYGGIQTDADRNVYASLASISRKINKYRKQQEEQNVKLEEQASLTSQNRTVTKYLVEGKMLSQSRAVSAPTPTQVSNPADAPSILEEFPNWPAEVRQKVQELNRAVADWDEDTTGRLFGPHRPKANGRWLDVKIVTELDDALVLSAKLSGIGGESLEGFVWFALHPTFPERFVAMPVRNGQAEMGFYSMDWFSLVAIADEGRTVLVYDMRHLPDAPDWFIQD